MVVALPPVVVVALPPGVVVLVVTSSLFPVVDVSTQSSSSSPSSVLVVVALPPVVVVLVVTSPLFPVVGAVVVSVGRISSEVQSSSSSSLSVEDWAVVFGMLPDVIMGVAVVTLVVLVAGVDVTTSV